MYRYIKNSILILLSSLIITVTSCKKFTEIDPPKNSVIGKNVFTDSLSASSAVLGIYSILNSNALVTGNVSTICGLSADELNKIGPSSDELQIQNNSLTADNATINSLWSSAYLTIANANACLAGIETSTALSKSNKDKLSGEARFLRAFGYLYLVNMFGSVPLVITNDYQSESTKSRDSLSQVYAQILSDLTFAESVLPERYASGTKVRATKWAAIALLARTYLYLGNWDQAMLKSDQVIKNSGTSLEKLSDVFLIGSNEAIWQIQKTTSRNNSPDYTLIYNFGSGFFMTKSLLDSFEPGDERMVSWTKIENNGSDTFYYPFKYKADAYTGPTSEYTVALRLAEQYLIHAEAATMMRSTAVAIDDLNTIRNRAALPNLSSTLSQTECVAAVEKERKIELFAEWGHRWIDLKRLPGISAPGSSRANEILTQLKNINWQSTDQLYPIPLIDIQMNKNLTQNPGY